MPSISIFIICKNEARIIARCLEQACKLADEIILVDSGSTDSTLEIAAKYKPIIYQQAWLGYSEQKNYALSKCTNEWVLSIDADEILSDELIEEIKSLDFKADAYQIARKLFIQEHFIRYGGYFPDYQLRLFKKSQGRFCDREVHESVEMISTGKNRSNYPKLKNPLNHYSYNSLEEMEQAFVKFAKLSNKKPNLLFAVINFVYSFINKFVFRLGLLQGYTGLRLALIHAKYSFLKYQDYTKIKK